MPARVAWPGVAASIEGAWRERGRRGVPVAVDARVMEAYASGGKAGGGRSSGGAWRQRLRENGLTLALLAFFAASMVGQIVAGHRALNAELADHGRAALSLTAYLTSGHFVEAVFENWESEFLQMAAFVLFTVWLKQKGSTESNPLEGKEGEGGEGGEGDAPVGAEAPWAARQGGLIKAAYSHSLSMALGLLFVGSFVMHALGGMREHNREQAMLAKPIVSLFGYMLTSQFWFESFQNWQSEFFSVAALVVLSIFLREKGSSQSKPVAAPHHQTGP